MNITITLRQAQKLVEFFGGHDCEVAIVSPVGDQPPGWYAYCTEYPEEGCEYLGPTEVDDELAASGVPPIPQADPVRAAAEALVAIYGPLTANMRIGSERREAWRALRDALDAAGVALPAQDQPEKTK
jgi:hypothetical protein